VARALRLFGVGICCLGLLVTAVGYGVRFLAFVLEEEGIEMRHILALLVLLVVGCGPVTTSSRPTVAGPDAIPPDTATLLLNPTVAYPTPLHAAIWVMVESCLGVAPNRIAVNWAVADSIVSDPTGRMPYGMVLSGSDGSVLVVLERRYWFNPAVVSHELVHHLGRVRESSPFIETCTMYVGLDMPERAVAARELPGLRRRATVIQRRNR